jgi:enamine deaminase RidA (YjgF/YER057c/UK114 family)
MKIYPCYYGGDLMPWANSVVAGNLIFLSGSEGRDPSRKQEYPEGIEPKESPVVEGVEAQTVNGGRKVRRVAVEKCGT